MKTFLNLGCGVKDASERPPFFEGWAEIRVDADPECHPDIVASMTDLSQIASASMDAVFTSHALEHLELHEVPVALAEMARVLKAEGTLFIRVPNLEAPARAIVEDRLQDALMVSPAGPITAHDMLYGHGASLEAGRAGMAHRCGFTPSSLRAALEGIFEHVSVRRLNNLSEIWAEASMTGINSLETIPQEVGWTFEAMHPQERLFRRLSEQLDGYSLEDVMGAGLNLFVNALAQRWPERDKALEVFKQLVEGKGQELWNRLAPTAEPTTH